MSGGVEGLFLVISHTFPIYKQLSTQGTMTSCSCSLNKLDVKNHWVLRDLENPQVLQPRAFEFSKSRRTLVLDV